MHHTESICGRAIYNEAALSWAVDALWPAKPST